MPKTLESILGRLQQIDARANVRRTRNFYTEEMHLEFLRFDLQELLADTDEAITAAIPPRQKPAPAAMRAGNLCAPVSTDLRACAE